jgi:hypothetical protein
MTDDKPIYWQDTPEGEAWADWAYNLYFSLSHERPGVFGSWPKWVLNHYARIKENNSICDILECKCHWVDSMKDLQVKAEWDKKRQDWLDKWERKK